MTEEREASRLPEGERIAKFLAHAGLCSRREAERWIEAGRVSIDGAVITTPALTVTAANRVAVDGKIVAVDEEKKPRLWLYHKPRGLITTHNDPEGRPTVFTHLPEDLPRVISVGRLDVNSEGLLLLTTSGELARYMELPATGWQRRYRVRAYGSLDMAVLGTVKHGITIEGIHYAPAEVQLESQQGKNSWLSMVIREGKNREVRKIFQHFGLQVNRLIRVAYGPFELGNIPLGKVKEVPYKKVKELI